MNTYTREKIDQIAATLDCRVVGLRQSKIGQTVTVCRDSDTSAPVRQFVHAGAGVFLDFAEGHAMREKAFRQMVVWGMCSSRDWSDSPRVWARVLELLEN
jgi:hypothetical protein